MRRPVLLIFINAMILIVVFCLMTQSLVIIQRIARAEKISGLVEVRRSGKGEFMPLTSGAMIKTGDVVRSGEGGVAEFKWADGTRWKIMPRTEITVAKSAYNALKKADVSELRLASGKVFIRIIKALRPTSRFEVETPTAVAAVRGTIFSVEYQNGISQIAVYKGCVDVRSDSGATHDETLITPGHAAVSTAPGDLAQIGDTRSARAFASEKSIVLPELTAAAQMLPDGAVLVSGQTESGNRVTVNGKTVRVLGNGLFRRRLPQATPQSADQTSVILVTVTDKHRASVTQKIRWPVVPGIS